MFWIFLAALVIFALALTLALVEVEAEGIYGWAEKMPTWYRINGWAARAYAVLMSGRPLTGYRLFMFFLIPGFFHLQYVVGGEVVWSIESELKTLGMYAVFCPLWDFLWFVMNPHHGIQKFRKELIWWHSTVYWIKGRVPLDYVIGCIASFAFVGLACVVEQSIESMVRHAITFVFLGLFTLIAIILAPRYHRWRKNMSRRDDRPKTWIKHHQETQVRVIWKRKKRRSV